jgi:23S rRNA 5-hydroxycytidine C2501 synthase
MREIELLAPARNLESGKIAINYGADAVYIGADRFGARAAAGNSLSDIETLIRYAHLYKAKVFITLNTILYDHELEEARKLIIDLYQAGADALIIQDMGLLELDLPPIPLHASTQTHNFDADKIQFLDALGFERIVLARELNLNEIQSIRQKVNAELEFFIHGALCVSLSGRCFFSQTITGRSANRGQCAQMCRHPYNLIDKNGHRIVLNSHLLSLKDLNNSAYLKDLVQSGISSFKIEGRLKDELYVKNVVSYYRQQIDLLLEKDSQLKKPSSGSTKINFVPDPEKSFNRFSTNYFLNSRDQGLVNPASPKSMGKWIGEVISIHNNSLKIASQEKLHNGDGLCFIDQQELKGLRVETTNGEMVIINDPKGIKPGTQLYRNYDHEFSKQLENDQSIRKIKAEISLKKFNNQLLFILLDEDHVETHLIINEIPEASKDQEKAIQTIQNQLTKSGNSSFDIQSVFIDLPSVYFFRISELNEIRRSLITKHEAHRLASYPKKKGATINSAIPFPKTELDFDENIANQNAKEFYKRRGVKILKPALEISKPADNQLLMTTRYCIKYELGFCTRFQNPENAPQEPLYLEDQNRKYQLSFDCKNCLMQIRLSSNESLP